MPGEKIEPSPEITPEMIQAGLAALAAHCPMDVAFPLGEAETAVRAVISAAIQARARPD